MEYKVYIQSMNNRPIADWAMSAYQGFSERQMNIIFFEDIEEVPASKYNIVVAYIGETNSYLERLGLPPKMSLNVPEEIEDYAGRWIYRDVMGWFRWQVAQKNISLPIFIKPDGGSKKFIAGVMSKPNTIEAFHEVEDEEPILLSEVVDFVSEYRCYVIKGELKGIKHYSGNIRVFPDVQVIDNAIKDYKSAPSAYAIDFGITTDGRTLLVECNDGFSLGNYGLDHSLYAKLLLTRWIELTKGAAK